MSTTRPLGDARLPLGARMRAAAANAAEARR